MKKNIIYSIKLLLTIYFTIIFNIFMVQNFHISYVALISLSLPFSMIFWNLLSHNIKFIDDTKEIL